MDGLASTSVLRRDHTGKALHSDLDWILQFALQQRSIKLPPWRPCGAQVRYDVQAVRFGLCGYQRSAASL
jgi:hypothetical protein